MKRLITTLSLVLALAASVPLRAQGGSEVERQAATLGEQGPALQALLKRNREGQADPEFTLDVLRGAKKLEDQGLPAEPYLLKANEGLAKRVSPRSMAPALDQTDQRTRSAGALVDGAMAQGAAASPETRRRSILQLQSALMSGRSDGDLEKAMKRGFAESPKPSLIDLTEEAVGPGWGGKKKEPKQPLLPSLQFPSGSEKPGKVDSPGKVKAEHKDRGFEKESSKTPSKIEKKENRNKPGKSKESSERGGQGNSRGKSEGNSKKK